MFLELLKDAVEILHAAVSGQSRKTVLRVGWLVLFASVYGALLYFRAATASLFDDYQPGIELLRQWLNPLWIAAVVWLAALIKGTAVWTQFARDSAATALLLCLLMYLLVASHRGTQNPWQFPQERTLTNTVQIALLAPNFSSRSKLEIAVNGALSGLCLVAYWLQSRRKRKAPNAKTAKSAK